MIEINFFNSNMEICSDYKEALLMGYFNFGINNEITESQVEIFDDLIFKDISKKVLSTDISNLSSSAKNFLKNRISFLQQQMRDIVNELKINNLTQQKKKDLKLYQAMYLKEYKILLAKLQSSQQ